MKYLVVVCLLIAMIVSCSIGTTPTRVPLHVDRPQTYILHIDGRFTPQQRTIIFNAFVEWQTTMRNYVTFELAEPTWSPNEKEMTFRLNSHNECTNDVFIIKIKSDHPSIHMMEHSGIQQVGNTLGYTSRTCEAKFVALVVDRISSTTMFRNVILHEVGHLCGLDHLGIPNESIMYPSQDKSTRCITSLDAKYFCDLYGCDWRNMLFCR